MIIDFTGAKVFLDGVHVGHVAVASKEATAAEVQEARNQQLLQALRESEARNIGIIGKPPTALTEIYCRCRCDITPLIEHVRKTADSFAESMQLYERLQKLKWIGFLSDEAIVEIKDKALAQGDAVFILDQVIDAMLGGNSYMLSNVAAQLHSEKLQELSMALQSMAKHTPFNTLYEKSIAAPRNREERRKKAKGRKGGKSENRKNWERKTYYE